MRRSEVVIFSLSRTVAPKLLFLVSFLHIEESVSTQISIFHIVGIILFLRIYRQTSKQRSCWYLDKMVRAGGGVKSAIKFIAYLSFTFPILFFVENHHFTESHHSHNSHSCGWSRWHLDKSQLRLDSCCAPSFRWQRIPLATATKVVNLTLSSTRCQLFVRTSTHTNPLATIHVWLAIQMPHTSRLIHTSRVHIVNNYSTLTLCPHS